MRFMFESCKKAGYSGYCDPVVIDAREKYFRNDAEILHRVEEINGICEKCRNHAEEEAAFNFTHPAR